VVTLEQVDEARDFITAKTSYRPSVGMILGSGLGHLADMVTDRVTISYRDIPHFAATSVDLHAGELVLGRLDGKQAAIMCGRLHYYEGHDLDTVTFPVFALHAIGVRNLIVTNACGAINQDYRPGEIMVISDHINTSGMNPLRGPNDSRLGPRFPEMSAAYSPSLRKKAHGAAEAIGVRIREGVYAWWCGPSLETPAEIRMLRTNGADAVGMSTSPEVMVANYLGMRVLGMACIGNMASGLSDVAITAETVAATVAGAGADLSNIIRGVLPDL
jgi:purine-nucleoside phosphorylase